MTRHFLLLSSALLLLSACETNQQDKEAIKEQAKADAKVLQGRAEQSATRVANQVRDQVKKTSMLARKWWLTPLDNPPPTPVPPSYCYQVMQDIVCYRDAMPGMSHKLVGYQGDNTQPPPVAQTKALPALRIPKQTIGAAGAARVANAKPVFVKIPTPVKEDKSQKQPGTAPELGSEPLPDPTHSPQL
jgi:hypothetical protein